MFFALTDNERENSMRTFLVALMTAIVGVCSLQAEVDLELRSDGEIVEVGNVVEVDLYFVADNNGADDPFCAAQLIVTWDETRLTLLGNEDDEPGVWMLSGFPADDGLDGLNNSFDDGDAYYHLWCWLGEPAAVSTPGGLYITTFQFMAIAPGDAGIEIIDEYGYCSVTAVLDEEIPGWNIVGDLGNAEVTITDEYGGWNILDEIYDIWITVTAAEADLAPPARRVRRWNIAEFD
jgi:hypothetical protein